MQTEENMRTDLWTLAVALYKTSLASHEEVEKWDRHAMAFDSHECLMEMTVRKLDFQVCCGKCCRLGINIVNYWNAGDA